MEVVHLCLSDIAFRGHSCEMQYLHIVSNMDKPPPGVAADLTHIVAVQHKGTRIFWNGSAPKRPAAKKRKQPQGQGNAPKRARAICDVESHPLAIADGSLDANDAGVAATVGDTSDSCSSDSDQQNSSVADGRLSEQEFGHREVEEASASSSGLDDGDVNWDKDSSCNSDGKDICCPGCFFYMPSTVVPSIHAHIYIYIYIYIYICIYLLIYLFICFQQHFHTQTYINIPICFYDRDPKTSIFQVWYR